MAEEIKVSVVFATAGAKRNVKEFSGELKEMEGQTKKTSKNASGSFASLKGSAARNLGKAGLIGIAVAASGAVVLGFNRMIQKGKEYQTSLADLEAITGITGDQLDQLSSNALDLSVKYGESASRIIEANKLVASQLAEKIDFGTDEGLRELQEVSEQAVVLQKAAGVDLATSVRTLTTAINQFNLPASETERLINSIAAGSKFGAAEVADQAAAYKEAGSVAASANIAFEELNGSTQILAANAILGSQAGTQQRNVFLTLNNSAKLAENGIEGVDLKSDGLAATLAKLNPLLEDSAALEKLFGRESITAAQILIKNADAVQEMTDKVTGSNIVQEQLAVKMDTAEVATNRFTEAINNELIAAFQESGGVMVQALNILTEWVGQTGYAIRVINDYFDAHSELRDQLEQNAIQLTTYRKEMQSLREEMAEATLEGEYSAEQEEEIRQSYEASTEALKDKARALFDDVHADKTRRKELQETIKSLRENASVLDLLPGPAEDAYEAIDRLEHELEGLNLTIASNQELYNQYIGDLKEGEITFDQFTQKMRELKEAQDDNSESTDDQSEGVKNLSKEIEENQKRVDDLINKNGELTDSEYAEVRALTALINSNKELLDLRKQAADPSLMNDFDFGDDDLEIGASIEADAAGMSDGVNEEESKAHKERMDQMDQRAKKARETGNIEKDVWAGIAQSIGEASAEQILYADNVKEATAGVIKALVSEMITRAMLSAFNPPTPASLALAPVLAAGVTRLVGSLIPSFRSGVDNFEGGLAKVHKNEIITHLPKGSNVITNKNVQAMERMNRQRPFISDVGRGSNVMVQPADNRDILSAIERQTERMERMERRVEFNMSEFNRKYKSFQKDEALQGRS